jgi:hypothetical protein
VISSVVGAAGAFDRVLCGGIKGLATDFCLDLGFRWVAVLDEVSGMSSPRMEANNTLLSTSVWARFAM